LRPAFARVALERANFDHIAIDLQVSRIDQAELFQYRLGNQNALGVAHFSDGNLHEFLLKISTTLSLPMTDRKFNRMVVRMEPFVLALGSGFYLRVSGKSVQLPWAKGWPP
jgi:hypothetical protein